MSNEDIMRQAMLAQSMGSQPSFWRSMQAQGWNNPLLNIGMGILAANKPGASFGQAVGGGGLLGMQNYQASQYQQARMDELKRKREEEDRARQAQMQQQERLEQWLATLPPQIQQMYRANPELAMKVLESQLVPKEPGRPVQAMVDGSPQWVNPRDAIGLPPVPGTPLVQMGDAPVQMPTDEEVMRQDILKRAEDARTYLSEAVSAGTGALRSIPEYNRIMSLLENVETGTGSQFKVAAKRLGKALGVEVDNNMLANEEELRNLLGNRVMERIGETKGAISEKEMAKLEEFSANYGNTAEGNKRIMQFRIAAAKRDVEIMRLIRRLQDQNKTSLQIRRAVEDFYAENDLGEMLAAPETISSGIPIDKNAIQQELERRRQMRQGGR